MPASVPEKTEVRVQRFVRMRLLCWTEGGWSGEYEGEIVVAPAGFSGVAGFIVERRLLEMCL